MEMEAVAGFEGVDYSPADCIVARGISLVSQAIRCRIERDTRSKDTMREIRDEMPLFRGAPVKF